jgi:hypothetical protein
VNAGRELDILVAKSLGYWVYHYDKDYAENCYYELMEPDSVTPVVGWPPRKGERKTEAEAWEDAPDFSTDTTAALIVVEALRTRTPKGYEFELHLKPPKGERHPRYEAHAIFGQDFYRYRRFSGFSETGSAPHAICLAALAAVGTEAQEQTGTGG